MSKKYENQRNNKGNPKKAAEEFVNFTKKDAKKVNKQRRWGNSKKEIAETYYSYLTNMLPDAMNWVLRYGFQNNEEAKSLKNGVYTKLCDPKFVKYLTKCVKKDRVDVKSLRALPMLIREIAVSANRENAALLAENPNTTSLYDVSDLLELSALILDKPMKKLRKKGIEGDLSFDILSIFPYNEAFNISQRYRIKSFFDTLYKHAKEQTIPFTEIIDALFTEEQLPALILFCLLEKKEVFADLTEKQKDLYLNITNWCFDTLEGSKKSDIEAVIVRYAETRKKDAEIGKDVNRRFTLSNVPESEYPKLLQVITKTKADNPEYANYL